MQIVFSEHAERELDRMDQPLRLLFMQHAEKIAQMPPRRHLGFGVPCNVEDVTRQARMVFEIEKETCYILHCFKSHKEYEKWYKQFF